MLESAEVHMRPFSFFALWFSTVVYVLTYMTLYILITATPNIV